jgi:hypothetical protein
MASENCNCKLSYIQLCITRLPSYNSLWNKTVQQEVRFYEQLGVSCYSVTACPALRLPSDYVQVANMRTHKRETTRSTKAKETYVEAAKEFLRILADQEKRILNMQLIL